MLKSLCKINRLHRLPAASGGVSIMQHFEAKKAIGKLEL